jgi:hypothetical protein
MIFSLVVPTVGVDTGLLGYEGTRWSLPSTLARGGVGVRS